MPPRILFPKWHLYNLQEVPNEIIILLTSGITILRNGIVVKEILYPDKSLLNCSVDSTLLLKKANSLSLYRYENTSFQKICDLSPGDYNIVKTIENTYLINNSRKTIFKIKENRVEFEKKFLPKYELFLGFPYNDILDQQLADSVIHYLGQSNFRASDYRKIYFNTNSSPKKIVHYFNNRLHYGFLENEGILSKVDEFEAGCYATSPGGAYRFSHCLLKYPFVYNTNKANDIYHLSQDSKGRIWAGNYQGNLAIIDKKNVIHIKSKNKGFLSGAYSSKKYQYAFTEDLNFVRFNLDGIEENISKNNTGFIQYAGTNGKVYFGMNKSAGLWIADAKNLNSNNPSFSVIDSTKGILLHNIIALTEDKKGRVWGGQLGIFVYDSVQKQAKTWLYSDSACDFTTVAMVTDQWGTVWIGGNGKGLLYYDDYTVSPEPSNLKKILHPLLRQGMYMSIKVWGNWLVISQNRDIFLLDLEKWHSTKEVKLRYINPHETNFTNIIEQNVFVTDRRDSTLWFSTTDNLYQWNIKTWLSFPTYRVKPNVVFVHNEKDSALAPNGRLLIKPNENSIGFRIWFQSKDNMPRYMSVALVKEGDTIKMPGPSLETKFQYNNLAPGNYKLIIDIFQSDGTTSRDIYPVKVDSFWWQKWWVWLLAFLATLLPIIIILNEKRKRAILLRDKAEKEKQLGTLQLVSLSSQFRPHFILNALNAIGARMDKDPASESVLSRLGESVNLIFNHSKQQKVLHDFATEWKLVENVIEIHQLMYLKQLQTSLPGKEIIEKNANVQLPMGLLQIPVENALLHGLSNKQTGPWHLWIDITEHVNHLFIHIKDNGVGRVQSAGLSNFTKHGTGTKNLTEIIGIINSGNKHQIALNYQDLSNGEGTIVEIKIPKSLNEKIKPQNANP